MGRRQKKLKIKEKNISIQRKEGFGLFTMTPFDIGDFLREYSGRLISGHCDSTDGDYIYYFQHQGKDYLVDGTDSPHYGRLYINDGVGKNANCKMKIVCTSDSVPHLCLFATRKISEDTELRYDYGVKDLLWRKKIVDLGSGNALEWLANHMGHNISVHRNYYRLQEHTLELAKVSKPLIAVDRGECSQYAGENLDDITLDDIDTQIREKKTKKRRTSFDNCEGTCQKKTKKRRTSVDIDESIHQKNKTRSRISTGSDNGRKKVQRNPWCDEETELLQKYFHWNIVNRSSPSKADIFLQGRKNEKVHDIIQTRGWKKVKYYLWCLAQQHDIKKNKLLN